MRVYFPIIFLPQHVAAFILCEWNETGLNTKYAELYFETVSFPTDVNNTVADESYSDTHTHIQDTLHRVILWIIEPRIDPHLPNDFGSKKTCLEYNAAPPLHNENAGPLLRPGGGGPLGWSCIHWLIFSTTGEEGKWEINQTLKLHFTV